MNGQIESFLKKSKNMSGEYYTKTHLMWRGSSNQQEKVSNWFSKYINGFSHKMREKKSLRIISVGCGTGILDKIIVKCLKDTFMGTRILVISAPY